ncbi:MAG: DNA polymerase III subunit beta [Bradymonadales bacterium]|nr:DNA polymerase III subunit beta [Bradymonadales bacterium]
MLVSIEPKRFAAELYKLLGVANVKGPLAVVSNALITANPDNTINLEATDLEVTISTAVECAVQRPGQLCLNAHNLYNVVKGLTVPVAEISALENSWAQLRYGDVDCRIVGIPPVEFPRLPTFDDLSFFSIGTSTLLEMIERTIISVSTDEGRPNLTGGYLSLNDNQLVMVATDGHRLSKVIREIDQADEAPEDLEKGIIIPRKSLIELKRTLDTAIPQVGLAVSGNNAVFRFGTTTIMVRLIDAGFPDYNRVIPKEMPERQAVIRTDEFTQKLRFVSLFSSPRTNNLSLALQEERLEFTASDPDTGEGRESMAIEYTGPKVQVGFNHRYLTDVMGILKEPHFRFQVTDTFSASLVLDGDRQDDLFLIMPMRL